MRHAFRFAIALLAVTAAVSGQDNVVTTKSGLRYIDHQVGTGDLAVLGAVAETHFEGWVAEHDKKVKKFDSSIDGVKRIPSRSASWSAATFRASMKACKV